MVKTCAFCEKTDGMCYTSNPPKRKCTITGKFHEYDHICDVPITNADRIRAMSDEELVKFINHFNICDLRTNDECKMSYCACCEVCVMDWLQAPAEEV